MGNFASGKYAYMISDRSGQRFPYTEMVQEWNGSWVHISEYESKQPQLQPRPTSADPQALQHPKPSRTAFPTPIVLRNDPFVMTAASKTVTVFTGENEILQDSNPWSTGDALRFTEVKKPVGGVAINTLQLETTLNGNITSDATTITLADASEFPTSGFIVIKKVSTDSSSPNFGDIEDETIEYTGRSSNNLTGCIRGTSAPAYGRTYSNTTASSHNSGAKVFGSYIITKVSETATNDANSTQSYSNKFTISLVSNAASTETGGGFFAFAGPVNQRS